MIICPVSAGTVLFSTFVPVSHSIDQFVISTIKITDTFMKITTDRRKSVSIGISNVCGVMTRLFVLIWMCFLTVAYPSWAIALPVKKSYLLYRFFYFRLHTTSFYCWTQVLLFTIVIGYDLTNNIKLFSLRFTRDLHKKQ